MRGFGVPETAWAREMNLDDCALALGIDRLEIRLRNLAHYREEFVPGDTPADGRWEQTVQRAAELIDWGKPLPPHCGRGLAVAAKSGPTTGLSYSTVRLARPTAAPSCSPAPPTWAREPAPCSPRSSPRNWASRSRRISVIMGDTAVVPFDQQTSASRSTVIMGNGGARTPAATSRLRSRAVAARLHRSRGVGHHRRPRRGAAARPRSCRSSRWPRPASPKSGGEYVGNGIGPQGAAPPATPSRARPTSSSSTARPSKCRWTRSTGEVTVLRHVTVGDTGKSLNPMQVRGQDDGAAIQGLGHALMEHYIFDETGRVRNLGAIDYRIPTSKDLPLQLISEQIENGDGPGPYGAKGVSEGSILCVAPALGAAVRDAIGVAIRDLPLTPGAGVASHARREMSEKREVGPAGDIPPAKLVEAARLVKQGRAYSLSVGPVPGHAALPGASALPGAELPQPGGDPGRGSPALGAAQRRRPGLHGRVPAGHLPLGGPHRRPGAHDGGPGQPLVRRGQHRRAPHGQGAEPGRRREAAGLLHPRGAARPAHLPGRRRPAGAASRWAPTNCRRWPPRRGSRSASGTSC